MFLWSVTGSWLAFSILLFPLSESTLPSILFQEGILGTLCLATGAVKISVRIAV